MPNSPIDAYLDQQVKWELVAPPASNPDGLPYATHSGILEIMGNRLRCHRLSDGQAIIDAEDFQRVFGEFMPLLEEQPEKTAFRQP